MRTPGVWGPTKNPDGSLNTTSWDFHIESKNRLREMIASDPDATGKDLDFINKMNFNEKLALTEKGEDPIPNEIFLEKMFSDYLKNFKRYNPPLKVRLVHKKALTFFNALMKNDIAYYERFMAMINYIVMNHERFGNPTINHHEEIKNLEAWWKSFENRTRTLEWIDWGFKFLINHYNQEFYFKSVNHIFEFINLNYKNWVIDPRTYPDHWFGNARGSEVNAYYGGNY